MPHQPNALPAVPIATRRERILLGGAGITLLAVTAYALNNTTAGQLFVETAQAAARDAAVAQDNATLLAIPAAIVFGIARAVYNNRNTIYNRVANLFPGIFQPAPAHPAPAPVPQPAQAAQPAHAA